VPDEVDLAGRHPVAFGFGHVLTRVSQAGGPLVNRHESDQQGSNQRMAFKPNYRQARLERERVRAAKRAAKAGAKAKTSKAAKTDEEGGPSRPPEASR
jgi:hypothetical protein